LPWQRVLVSRGEHTKAVAASLLADMGSRANLQDRKSGTRTCCHHFKKGGIISWPKKYGLTKKSASAADCV
jgi:hypothetical protein